MTTPPIDRQQISLTSAAVIVVMTFGVGAGWTIHETRLAALEADRAQDKRLLNAICRKLNCDAEGMRS